MASSEILNGQVIQLVLDLDASLEASRQILLSNRSSGGSRVLDFRRDTLSIRQNDSWRGNSALKSEILTAKSPSIDVMVPACDFEAMQKALNDPFASGIQFDFDDAHCSSFEAALKGYRNFIQAVKIQRKAPETIAGRIKIIPRPRALHLSIKTKFPGLPERFAGCLLDIAVCMVHRRNFQDPVRIYIPKIESMEEAIWWQNLLDRTEEILGIERYKGIECIVLIENIWAIFQTEEILFALRQRCVALNAGKWDYIFSFVKAIVQQSRNFIMPSRRAIRNDCPAMISYLNILTLVCDRRGIVATTGMASQIFNPDLSPQELSQIRTSIENSKKFEARLGSQGALVADTNYSKNVFNAFAKTKTRISVQGMNSRKELLQIPADVITLEDVNSCLKVIVFYIHAWIYRGEGFVVLDGVVEDLATAEICRSLLWLWIKRKAPIQNEKNETIQIDEHFVKKLLIELESNEKISSKIVKPELIICTSIVRNLLLNAKLIEWLPDYIDHIFLESSL